MAPAIVKRISGSTTTPPTTSDSQTTIMGTVLDGTDYFGATWGPGTVMPVWVALDLNGVVAADRKNCAMVIDHTDSDYLDPASANGYPSVYTIRANASVSSTVPVDGDAGWVTLVTHNSTHWCRTMDLVGDLSSYRWVEFRCTTELGAGGLYIRLFELLSVPQGASFDDLIGFIGDSTTGNASVIYDIWGNVNLTKGTVAKRVQSTISPPRWPGFMYEGNGGQNMAWGYTNRSLLIDNVPGKLIVIQLGLNDANGSSSLDQPTLDAWHFGAGGSIGSPTGGLLGLVDYAVSKGKTVMLGRVQWANEQSSTGANALTLSQIVDGIVSTERPSTTIKGPDMYTVFRNLGATYLQDGLHPGGITGNGGGIDHWVDEIANALKLYWYVGGATSQGSFLARGQFGSANY